MKKINIVVVDYEMSNIFSIKNMFSYLGVDVNITSSIEEIRKSDALILPGVGAFGAAMDNLRRLGLVDPIREFVEAGKPFLGICLGLQLLFSKSDEFGDHRGLNLIEGNVIKLPNSGNRQVLRIPCVGWNQLSEYNPWQNSPLKNIKKNDFVYFVHSYYVKPKEDKWIMSTSQYGNLPYCSSVQKDNIFATQFHPEKSGSVGMAILQDWIGTIK